MFLLLSFHIYSRSSGAGLLLGQCHLGKSVCEVSPSVRLSDSGQRPAAAFRGVSEWPFLQQDVAPDFSLTH